MSEAAQFNDLMVLLLMAVIAPLLVIAARRLRISAVVLEILLGILVGPYVLGWVTPGGVVESFGVFGLALLFFLAGFEIEPARLKGKPLHLATLSWFSALAVGLSLGAILALTGVVIDSLLVGLALTTTALGTLLPILRDQGELGTTFGRYVTANGAVGEFGPIVAIALLFAGKSPAVEALVLVGFVVLIALALWVSRLRRPEWLQRALHQGLRSSSQLPVRLCLLLVAFLVYVAAELGLDMLLGAFAAGVIVRFALAAEISERDVDLLSEKLEGIGFGVFIPIFFVSTGVNFDLDALFESPLTMLKVPFFLSLMLLARGVPTYLLHRQVFQKAERLALSLFTATALPLIVAITTIGLETDRMRPSNATALVAAGMLSVLVFPVLASTIRARGGAPARLAAPEGAEP